MLSGLHKKGRGFTVVELAVVVVVIGVLASFGVPRFMKSVERTKAAEAFHFLNAVQAAQERYKAREGAYAPSLTDLDIQWRKSPATGGPVLKYFEVAVEGSKSDDWAVVLTRKDVSEPYAVRYTKDGYDPGGSTIASRPEINPVVEPDPR